MPLYKLSSSSLPEYISFFNRHAIDNKLTAAVIKGILEKTGRKPTDHEICCLIRSISINSDGINAQAFIDYISAYHELRNPDTEYRAAFRLYDVKGEGRLSKSDVQTMFEQMHQTIDVNKLFEEADVDHNGFIDYDEYVTLMSK